ncbi:unnamed protein product [Orchesella dallaii]|uniref:Uncharacterized protein n=1 Tax=Orchesella dallaii TaxID=48710 RepID=A0ABP1PT26_9HEXA
MVPPKSRQAMDNTENQVPVENLSFAYMEDKRFTSNFEFEYRRIHLGEPFELQLADNFLKYETFQEAGKFHPHDLRDMTEEKHQRTSLLMLKEKAIKKRQIIRRLFPRRVTTAHNIISTTSGHQVSLNDPTLGVSRTQQNSFWELPDSYMLCIYVSGNSLNRPGEGQRGYMQTFLKPLENTITPQNSNSQQRQFADWILTTLLTSHWKVNSNCVSVVRSRLVSCVQGSG